MVHINKTRLLEQLDALASIGALPGGGVCRLAFSEADKQGRDFVERSMRELGLNVFIDPIGTILGVRPGLHSDRLVLTGSHTDTVATGGRYDGSLGVLAGLEVIHALNDAAIQTRHAIGVISFVNEEGVRFMPDMMGSLYLTGAVTLEELRATAGIDGKTIGECIDALGFAGEEALDRFDIESFIELHIEQGPILEEEEITIGIVDRVQGLSWWELTWTGEANHAGVTPMERRRDAGFAAASLVCELRRMTNRIEGLRATAGSISFSPDLINVIAEEARVTADLRHPDPDHLAAADEALEKAVLAIAEAENVSVGSRSLARVEPVQFDEACVSSIEKAAEALGYPAMHMTSGAGHDAQILARRYSASMIFVPSQGGISHNINEYTLPDHIEAGANVLLHAVLDRAEQL